jgi:hypothetical protein
MVDADLEIEKRNPDPTEGLSVPLSRAADADSKVRA